MDLQVVGEVGALGKKNQVRQREGSTDNLRRLILAHRHFRRCIAHRDRLRRKRTLARKGQRIAHILDIHRLGRQQGHVATDLLKVQRGHCNARRKHRLRHCDVRLITIQQIQAILDPASLLTILNRDGQVIGLGLGHRERDRIIVRHRLHNTVKVVRIETHAQLGSLVVVLVLLKLIRVQPHMRQHGARIVHGNHADTILIKNKAHFDQHGLQALGEGADGRRLDCLGNHKVVGAHLCMLEARCLSSSTQ